MPSTASVGESDLATATGLSGRRVVAYNNDDPPRGEAQGWGGEGQHPEGANGWWQV